MRVWVPFYLFQSGFYFLEVYSKRFDVAFYLTDLQPVYRYNMRVVILSVGFIRLSVCGEKFSNPKVPGDMRLSTINGNGSFFFGVSIYNLNVVGVAPGL